MIPVEWFNLHSECSPRDHWDTAWLQAVFAGRVKGSPTLHRGVALNSEPAFVDADHAPPQASQVIMVAGNFHAAARDIEILNKSISQYPGVVVIVHSDEEAVFPVEQLEHPNMRLWVQTPRPDRAYPEGTRFFGEGWSPYTPEILKAWGDTARTIEVYLSAQRTHSRRQECFAAFDHADRDRRLWHLYETPGFTRGYPRAQYLGHLRASKVALCPSGPTTHDTFRVWEALEAGCVPLVDDVTPDGRSGYWRFMLNDDPPFPLVSEWGDAVFAAKNVLRNFEAWQTQCQAWWRSYQQRLVDQLRGDVAAVRA